MKAVLLNSGAVRGIINGERSHISRSRRPDAKKGDRLFVKEALWVSECGKYYARPTYQQGVFYDVLSIDGKELWYGGDRTPQTEYPDYRFMVAGYGSRNNTRCKKRHAFELSFGEYDTGKKIIPLKGNTRIGEGLEAVFMKRISSTRMPKWAVRLWLDVIRVRGYLIEFELANSKDARWGD